MKVRIIIAVLLGLCLPYVQAAETAAGVDQQLTAVIKEIQAQQVLIADNQAKIEAKLASVEEAVRVARIYSSRSGK